LKPHKSACAGCGSYRRLSIALNEWNLSGTTGSFLMPGFVTATRSFALGFGFVGTQMGICHLAHESLVHQINTDWGFEDPGR
jgi:hypothetical protein